MFIVHIVRHSLVQKTPARISCYWGRYTEHRGASICSGRGGGKGQFQEPLNPYGIFYSNGKRGSMKRMIENADVVHCHDDAYPTMYCDPRKKRCVYHAHIGDIPRRFFERKRFKYHPKVRHACITNGYGRFFDEELKRAKVKWGRLPDILDLHNPLYSPVNMDKGKRLRVTFTYSNAHPRGRKINAKCPKETRKLLNRVKGIDLNFVTGVDFERSMFVKQRSHIVLDEIFSPYTHLSALEGAAVGACVLTSFDKYTIDDLCKCVGAPVESYPFVNVSPASVVKKVEHFRNNIDEAIEIGKRSRAWMLEYYSPEKLLQIYLQFYGVKN